MISVDSIARDVGAVIVAAAASGEVVDLTDWANRPAGSDGEIGYRASSVYAWDVDLEEWIAFEASAHTRTLVAYIAGDSATLAGWTKDESGGGTITTATVSGRSYVSLDATAGSSARANIARSWTSGRGIYQCGWVAVDNTSGTLSGSVAMVPYVRDGARIKHLHGCIGGPGARMVSGTSAIGMQKSGDSLATPVWLEVFAPPGGQMLARINGEPWSQGAAATQFATTSSTDIFLGDSAAGGSVRMLLADLTIADLQ